MRSVTSDGFLGALRRWPSGVTVVTMGEGLQAHGLTVSAFASVSLDPPTILVCINSSSRAHQLMAKRPCFAVNILAAGQSPLSDYFSRRRGVAPLENIPHHPGRTVSCPVLDGVAALLECQVATSVCVGTHVTYFGQVTFTEVSDRDPLLYFDGGYQDVIFGRRVAARVAETAGGTTRIDRISREEIEAVGAELGSAPATRNPRHGRVKGG